MGAGSGLRLVRLVISVVLLTVGSLDSRGQSPCNPSLVQVCPLSDREFQCAKVKVINNDQCYYRVQVHLRAHNPPDNLPFNWAQQCESCCDTNNPSAGKMCDCNLTLPVIEVAPNETTIDPFGLLRNCNGCPNNESARVCDRGSCTVTGLPCPCPAGQSCVRACTEAYITKATIVGQSTNGTLWAAVNYPMNSCVGCSPENPLPCGRCMPAQGKYNAATDECDTLEPVPCCRVPPIAAPSP